jgi:hypothetical protein
MENVKYLFMPIPGARKGEQTTSVCEVSSETHLKYMLDSKRSGTYREYDQDRSLKELEEYRKQVNAFKGFAVQKFMETGYIIVDMRLPKKQRFADMSGNWSEKRIGLSPWQTEIEAFQWLKEEIERGLIEPVEVSEEAESQKRGPGRPANPKKADEGVSKMPGYPQTHT